MVEKIQEIERAAWKRCPNGLDKGSGLLYKEGLQALADKLGISLDEAARIVEQDLQKGGIEHVEPTRETLEALKSQQEQGG